MSQLVTACLLITAMLGAAAALIRAVVWVWLQLRKVGRLADDLTGEPARPGFAATPGVLERLTGIESGLATLAPVTARLDALERRFEAVEAQMHPNGGSTLRDAVDRLEERAA